MTNILEVEDLRTEFHLRRANVGAVDGVSLTIAPGECVGLVGESGSGKSTTGLSIMQLLPSSGHLVSGHVRLTGRELVNLSEHEMESVRGNDVGMVFQDPMTSLNPTWRVGRQITEAVRLHREVTKEQANERALEVLRLVGVPRPEERLNAYPHELSGGLRQRVMIAIALACEPKLLIADEPTTALDATIQSQILDLLDELRERLSMAVLLITHDLGVIAARTSRVIVMYAGKVVESATTEELFAHMHHPYSEALVASIPRLDQDRSQRLYSIPGIPPNLTDPPPGCRFAPRCRYATDECRTTEPPLGPFAGAAAGRSHLFACFHPVSGPQALATQLQVHEPAVSPPTADGVTTPRPIALVVEHLVKEFSVTEGAIRQRRMGTVKAVSDVSFTVRRGETFGLVGESGCGKSTLGRLVVALEKPNSGVVKFEGENISAMRGSALRKKRRDMQLVFQDPYASLDPRIRVGPTIREPLIVQGMGSATEQHHRVLELLDEVGLPSNAAELYPHEFSGGQRQRIGLARALALNPKLIIADEPVSALDVSIQAQILNLMRSLQDRHQLTYVVISHDLAVMRYLADTIGVMYLGKLVEQGPADVILQGPAHPYTQGLINAIPVADPAERFKKTTTAVRGELPSAINPPSGCRFRTRCPRAADLCAEEEPKLRDFGQGQMAACHFPLKTPLDLQPTGTAAI